MVDSIEDARRQLRKEEGAALDKVIARAEGAKKMVEKGANSE